MLSLSRGRYQARFARTEADLDAAQALRWRCFVGDRRGASDEEAREARDCDAFDARCLHLLIEDRRDGRLVCCFRVMALRDGSEIAGAYSAQHYDLSGLSAFPDPMLELGRFCMAADCHDPDVLRIAWGAIAGMVDERRAGMLFGCSSFAGTDWEEYADSFALLAAGHIAPRGWRPRVKAPRVIRYARKLIGRATDPRRGLLKTPPLLRSYLSMGGWVSDHAVVDNDLDTLHVFTGLEIRAIPPARARALRSISGAGPEPAFG